MANPDDLKLLDSAALDLSGCDLSAADLSERQLPGRDFTRANLTSANARSANLSNSKFGGALLIRLDASGADCSGSSFAGCFMPNVSFANANLRNAVLSSTQIQSGDFHGADLRGANFRSATLLGGTNFEGVIVNEGTSFDGAHGPRELSRLPAFAGHSYEGGVFRLMKPAQGVAGTGVAGSVIPTTSPPTAGTAISTSAFDPNGFQTGHLDEQAAENAAQRIVADPHLFANLASYAASSISKELERLGAKIPNEPEALDGYERVRETLQRLQSDFQSLAETANRVQETESAPEKLSLAKTAVSAAQGVCAGFVGWLDQHGPQAGRVIAELGLAGVIAGTLTYFTGVSPTLAFSVSVAALSGKSIWEAVAMFAPNKKGDKN